MTGFKPVQRPVPPRIFVAAEPANAYHGVVIPLTRPLSSDIPRSVVDTVPPQHQNPRLHRFDLCLPDEGLQRVTLLDMFYEHPVSAHKHPWMQVHIMVEGCLSVRFDNGAVWDLKPGDGMVIPAGVQHHPGAGDDGRRALMIVMLLASHPVNSLERWLDARHGPWRWRCDPEALEQSLAQLTRLSSQPARLHPASVLRAVWGLFIPDDAMPPEQAPALLPRLDDPSIDKRVLFLEAMMRRKLTEPYDARRMAKRVQVSVSQMNRLFRMNRQMTPMRRLQMIRLEEARLYLANSSMPIKQISERCGFTNPIHFTRLFKQAYGRTPREYRTHLPE